MLYEALSLVAISMASCSHGELSYDVREGLTNLTRLLRTGAFPSLEGCLTWDYVECVAELCGDYDVIPTKVQAGKELCLICII